MREEPEYQVFDYECPHCGHRYRHANSVRLHPDHQVCPECGKSGAKVDGAENIIRVLNGFRRHGRGLFLMDGPITMELDSAVKGWG